MSCSSIYNDREPIKALDLYTRDDSYLRKEKSIVLPPIGIGAGLQSGDFWTPRIVDSTLKTNSSSGEFEISQWWCLHSIKILAHKIGLAFP